MPSFYLISVSVEYRLSKQKQHRVLKDVYSCTVSWNGAPRFTQKALHKTLVYALGKYMKKKGYTSEQITSLDGQILGISYLGSMPIEDFVDDIEAVVTTPNGEETVILPKGSMKC